MIECGDYFGDQPGEYVIQQHEDRYCPKCSRTPPELGLLDAKFCPQCGNSDLLIIPQERRIRYRSCRCGYRFLAPHTNYCSQCGTKVADGLSDKP
jgi:ribosomal protein S27AE